MGAIQALVQPSQLVGVALAGRGAQRASHTPEVVDHWGCLAASTAVAAARARLQYRPESQRTQVNHRSDKHML